jgi:hypothetical protein
MSVPGIELEQMVHLDRGGWFVVLLGEEHTICGLEHGAAGEKSRVSGKCKVRYRMHDLSSGLRFTV